MLPIKNFDRAVKSTDKFDKISSDEETETNELEETDGDIVAPSIEQSYRDSKHQLPSSRRNSNKSPGAMMIFDIPKAPKSSVVPDAYLDCQNTLTF